MALPSIARRLRTKHPLCLSLTLLHHHHHHPITNSPYSSLSLHPRLSQPFHPTSIVPSQTPRHFSTLRPFSAEIPHHPLGFNGQRFNTDHSHNLGLTQFLELLTSTAGLASEADAVAFLDESGVEPKRDTVFQAIWELRGDWKLAFLGFKWGEKWGCCDEEACSLMVWVFGSHRKFSTAWCLIRDLNQALIDTRRAMLIMIDRYASANHPRKAIKTFQIMEKFRLSPDQEAFHILLNALCKNGNMEEAEEFMLVSKKFFPLEVEGFNIVLNGWCNISVDVYQAKRVWREMSKYCITPDATSYTHMISCFSKEALKVLDKVKEIGLQPDATTYNSMIGPLCESKKIEEAQQMLSSMINDNLSPTIETYHAFLQSPGSKATVEVLNRMKKANLGPNGNTFLMILEKFFILEQPGKALEIWNEMKNYGVVPDSTHYTSMVQGLATCGLLAKAKELLAEMTSNGIPEDPKLKKLLKKPIGGSVKGKRRVRQVNQAKRINLKQDRVVRSRSPRQSRKKKTSSE
ncbi:pentatricopeptide repeat-containing protein At1g80880, mitochondrial isoform X2 [Rosa chinensis]|uniref:pentatricopeptide repeat-containing protein At1g80880, mitochondrial isoform X2 n=1 Tax=Rosa chinensis TaxID=74649 RepID=UPI000D0945F7|nr:pentatricopeptide repeat-containing protein At1g80880, mitochondrial isoform X2 [Rosa chinensis]